MNNLLTNNSQYIYIYIYVCVCVCLCVCVQLRLSQQYIYISIYMYIYIHTMCPTRYRTRLFCNNFATNEALGTLQTHSSLFLTQRTYPCSNFGFGNEWDARYIYTYIYTIHHYFPEARKNSLEAQTEYFASVWRHTETRFLRARTKHSFDHLDSSIDQARMTHTEKPASDPR
jgi:hypothetical protein